ncbi:NAD-dependent epimerase/dehydratase family protein [Candidatus Beckwithbacteria bacterium]|nr:NAD-dependent epimerase/dehydratase family protein [Candidatus Beckwithbacteria bacterium]
MNIYHGKNVLVTGGTGFVGSHLVEELIKLGAHVVTTYEYIDPKSYFITKGLDKNTVMAKVDIRNFDAVFDLVTKLNTEFIFHLAAQAIVETAYYNPRWTLESNINGTINIVESGRLFPKVKAIIVASSDKAYGKLCKKMYMETDALCGDHPYDVSKSATDLIAHSYFVTYGLPVVTTRFGNIYGEGDLNMSRIIPGIMNTIINKNVLELRSNGKFVRDYLYVKDVVAGYLLLAEKIEEAKGEAYNFGSEENLSVIDLIKEIEKALNLKIPYKILNTAKNEIPNQALDCKKIKALGWKQKQMIKDTMQSILLWYKSYLKGEISFPIKNNINQPTEKEDKIVKTQFTMSSPKIIYLAPRQ